MSFLMGLNEGAVAKGYGAGGGCGGGHRGMIRS